MGCFGMKLGMGYVVNKVLTLFDAGKIQQKEAVNILKACRRGSHWCNELSDDYIAPFGNFRCGRCLKKIGGQNDLCSISYWFAKKGYKQIPSGVADELVYDGVCLDCFTGVVSAYTDTALSLVDARLCSLQERIARALPGNQGEISYGCSYPESDAPLGEEVGVRHVESSDALLEVDGCRCWLPETDCAFEGWWFEVDRNLERLPGAWTYSSSRGTVLCQNDFSEPCN